MKNVSKILCLVLTLAMLMTIAPLSVLADVQPKEFSDISNHWAKSYINFWATQLSADGEGYVIGGYQDGTFRPNNKITRAEIAVILDRLHGFKDNGVNKGFSDVSNAYWAYEEIMDCADNKVIGGYEDGTFRPRNNCTRQAAIAMIARCVMTEENFAEFADKTAAKAFLASEFKDANQIPVGMYAEFCFLAKYGNLEGYSDGYVRPAKEITRAEFAKLLYASTFSDAKIYKLNVTVVDNRRNEVSDCSGSLTADDNVLVTIVPLIVANRNNFKEKFPSPDMRAILDEGVKIAQAGFESNWAAEDQTAWNNFVESHYANIGGAASAKDLFKNIGSLIGDMEVGTDYVMTFNDTYEGRENIVYTVTINVEVMS